MMKTMLRNLGLGFLTGAILAIIMNETAGMLGWVLITLLFQTEDIKEKLDRLSKKKEEADY